MKNPMQISVLGYGFIGIGKYPVKINGIITKAYRTWSNMLYRVYVSTKEHDIRSYSNVTICDQWLNFQVFAEWFHKQIDCFELVDFVFELDKDLLVPGNKIYSPETCCVIPEQVNMLFTDHAFKRGLLPLGVSNSSKNRYRVRVNSFGKQIHLGNHYTTIQSAQKAYWDRKIQIIKEVGTFYQSYLPDQLATRLVNFDYSDALIYYGDDAKINNAKDA